MYDDIWDMALVWYYVCKISRVSFSILNGSTGNLMAILKLGKTMVGASEGGKMAW
ncbi:hypothetical protein F383_32985 [Gossypium arboreum]|uniref:Uncharacterized protein n=1 Tax=Gossypium arboreum TaxID=29729 RepID=A0A0B0MX68_GOSAR|nr:hypothetical protein F383_32985 [Gossypium arboreum]